MSKQRNERPGNDAVKLARIRAAHPELVGRPLKFEHTLFCSTRHPQVYSACDCDVAIYLKDSDTRVA